MEREEHQESQADLEQKVIQEYLAVMVHQEKRVK